MAVMNNESQHRLSLASSRLRATQVAISITACLLGMLCTSEQMGTMIVFQGGMLMQLLPAFGLGFLGS